MKYLGGKTRLAKHLLAVMLKDRKPNQYYVEPFVGGGSVIERVEGNRIANDINPFVVACLKALSEGWLPPEEVSKEFYQELRKRFKEGLITEEGFPLVGYVGFACSFKGKFWNGFANPTKTRNYIDESFRNAVKQAPKLKGIEFHSVPYQELVIPKDSIIYCDIPYKGTTTYKGVDSFNYEEFWDWCRNKKQEGHKVFISEYQAPEDFTCVFEKRHFTVLNAHNQATKKTVERLFELKGN